MTEQIWNLDSELKKKKKEEEEAIGNLKLKKIVAGMKFLLGGLNSRFEMAKESLNLKVQSSRNYAIQIKKKMTQVSKPVR